jgi:outer membrane protein
MIVGNRALMPVKLPIRRNLRSINVGDSTLPHHAVHRHGQWVNEGLANRGGRTCLMKTILRLALVTSALIAATPALADDAPQGPWQIKLLATAVLPDGKISEVKSINSGLAANAAFASPQTTANDNVTPTLAVEYFFTPNISVETIAGITAHHVDGSGSLAGTNLVNHVLIIPATVTAKYHLPLGPVIPYVGVGPTWFLVMGERPGDTAQALGVTRTSLSSQLGVAVQAGIDIPIPHTRYGLSFDAKKYWVGTTAHFYAGDTEVLTTSNRLNPWVLSGGVSYRF